MAKFKVNDRVRIIATGEVGTVKGRDIIPIEGSKRVKIEYIVKIGNGFDNWKSFSKNEIQSMKKEKKEPSVQLAADFGRQGEKRSKLLD